jgi:predicted metalloprotease with PDZ domain
MSAADLIVDFHVTIDRQRLQLQVTAQFPEALASNGALQVQTPTWVPGSYNFEKFARDIHSMTATDATTGAQLPIRRRGWQGFEVSGVQGDVTISYAVAAFEPSFGEQAGIVDSSFAVLLGARYLSCAGHLGAVRVTYIVPEEWEGTIQHPSGAEHVDGAWIYPSFEVLVDTPVSMGEIDVYQRVVGGTAISFVFVDHGVGYAQRHEEFIGDVVEVVEFLHEMFGSFPFEEYTFVFSLGPQNFWGLEHLTSTMCGLGPSVFTDDDEYKMGVRVCAHEMFHAWNVRRLRPAPLADIDRALGHGSFTEGLWFAEGFTRYYEFVACAATGVYSPAQFLSNIIGYHEHLTVLPACSRVSAADSSYASFLNHNPRYPGQVNSSIDYYDKGMLIAFGADARLRLAGNGSNLNTAFREFYEHTPLWPEAGAGGGYTTEDVVEFLDGKLAGLGTIVRAEVESDSDPLTTLDVFEDLGFEVITFEVGYLGLFFIDKTAAIADVADNSPAGASGIAPGDVVVSIDGYQFTPAGLAWAAKNQSAVCLQVLRGHRSLMFTIDAGRRTVVDGLVWRGDDRQAEVLSTWFGADFVLQPGQQFPVDFYQNFHGDLTII